MKIFGYLLMFAVFSVECRKSVPIDKNAVVNFINMEGGGGMRPGVNTQQTPQLAPPNSASPNQPNQSNKAPISQPTAPKPAQTPTLQPAAAVTTKPVITPKPAANQVPTPVKPKPLNPAPAAGPITTPGPGTVKQLVTFYDSQGRGSPIRPYNYSQAVKQG